MAYWQHAWKTFCLSLCLSLHPSLSHSLFLSLRHTHTYTHQVHTHTHVTLAENWSPVLGQCYFSSLSRKLLPSCQVFFFFMIGKLFCQLFSRITRPIGTNEPERKLSIWHHKVMFLVHQKRNIFFLFASAKKDVKMSYENENIWWNQNNTVPIAQSSIIYRQYLFIHIAYTHVLFLTMIEIYMCFEVVFTIHP